MKRSSLILILLAIVSVANAELTLMLNGVDAAKERLEIKGKDNLVIAVAGQTQVDANDYFVTVSDGILEAKTDGYLFTFEGESSSGVMNVLVKAGQQAVLLLQVET